MHVHAGDLRVADRLGVRLGDVQLVVDVCVGRAGMRAERVQDRDGEIDLERRVLQHLAGVGLGHEAALVADDRAVHADLVGDAPGALEHPPRGEDHMDAAGLGSAHRRDRAR